MWIYVYDDVYPNGMIFISFFYLFYAMILIWIVYLFYVMSAILIFYVSYVMIEIEIDDASFSCVSFICPLDVTNPCIFFYKFIEYSSLINV